MHPLVDAIASIAQIFLINFVLSGDNALVIAMAERHLPPPERRAAMICGQRHGDWFAIDPHTAGFVRFAGPGPPVCGCRPPALDRLQPGDRGGHEPLPLGRLRWGPASWP